MDIKPVYYATILATFSPRRVYSLHNGINHEKLVNKYKVLDLMTCAVRPNHIYY